jgi:PncC family amidohydrolase
MKNVPDEMYAAAEEVFAVFLGMGKTLATAESCTGGLLGAALTCLPGSSDFYLGGVITYANETKTALLGVDAEHLRTQGAVNEKTAQMMACGLLARTGAEVAVAVTGVAGPAGGSPDKPVGTVFVCYSDGENEKTVRYNFSGERSDIRRQTVMAALGELKEFAKLRRS